MSSGFMDRMRSFLGIQREPPRNDFRNPIWGSDDEDDGDELYTKQNIDIYTDPMDMHQELAGQMQDIFKSFGSIFGDMRSLFSDEQFDSLPAITDESTEPENYNSESIRNYYLKPGYHNQKFEQHKDIDLDGKVSSNDIAGLLKRKEDSSNSGQNAPFNGNLVPGRSFCQTIITTSVTRPDGTVERRRIIKNGNEVIEETTTASGPDTVGPFNQNMDPIMSTGIIYNNVMSELSQLFKNFY